MSGKDKKDFDAFARLPLFVKLLMFPYFWAVVALLLIIIKKSQVLFTNFKMTSYLIGAMFISCQKSAD